MTLRRKQPELMNEFGVTFHGRAETIDGNLWWYESGGKRYPLMPRHPQDGVPDGELGQKKK
jgi:hypothetical protein